MVLPDYRNFVGSQFIISSTSKVVHSAKGSTWEDHKYIKRIDGTYYYPDSYEGGRHLPDGGSDESKEIKDSEDTISKLEDMTGMKRESLIELRDLGRKNGYDSNDFKELLDTLSEGDPDQAKKMVKLLKSDTSSETEGALSSTDIENLAQEVIRGNFGNGQQRKELLGDSYEQVQKRVNELLKGPLGSKKMSDISEETKSKAKKMVEKASTALINMKTVLSVYNKKK